MGEDAYEALERPDLPIEVGRPGPVLLAIEAVSKYCDGLPELHA